MPDNNTVLHYIYRDASNYKAAATTIFAGTATPADKERLEKALDDGHFISWQVGLEDARECDPMWTFGTNDDDHCWNEFVELRDTDQPPTDSRTITQFVDQVCAIDFWDDATHDDDETPTT